MSSELSPDAPVPRLCHLVKWPDFDGYGFNLHAEKSRTGQFIGKVDDDSPSQYAGLREGDRIIEVNGVNIANENHRQVVERIKSVPNETKLLVVDDEADRWYKERKLVIKSTQPNVLYVKTPVPRPSPDPPSYDNISSAPVNGVEKITPKLDNGVNGSKSSTPSGSPKLELKTNGDASHEKDADEAIIEREEQSPKVVKNVESSPPLKDKEEAGSSRSSTPLEGSGSVPDSPHSTKSSHSGGGSSIGGGGGGGSSGNLNGPGPEGSGLNLNMSASEMRQMLASRKKKDPKKTQMDIRQKYEIIQQM